MAHKNSKPVLLTIGVAAATSLVVSVLSVYVYFRNADIKQVLPIATKQSQDMEFVKYETSINGFLDKLRKGKIEDAYKETSSAFQKLSSQGDFAKLVSTWQSARSLPSSPCVLTQYSEPFSTTITGLTDTYAVITTKCEVKENGKIIGFDVEFIEDKGTPKISYINVYSSPILHTR